MKNDQCFSYDRLSQWQYNVQTQLAWLEQHQPWAALKAYLHLF